MKVCCYCISCEQNKKHRITNGNEGKEMAPWPAIVPPCSRFFGSPVRLHSRLIDWRYDVFDWFIIGVLAGALDLVNWKFMLIESGV